MCAFSHFFLITSPKLKQVTWLSQETKGETEYPAQSGRAIQTHRAKTVYKKGWVGEITNAVNPPPSFFSFPPLLN